jgi:hypothetical protein
MHLSNGPQSSSAKHVTRPAQGLFKAQNGSPSTDTVQNVELNLLPSAHWTPGLTSSVVQSKAISAAP